MTKEEFKNMVEAEGTDYLVYHIDPKALDDEDGALLLQRAQRAVRELDYWLEDE